MTVRLVAVVALAVFVAFVRGHNGVFEQMQSGFQAAGKLLGLDRSGGVAQMVSDAFGKQHKKGDGAEGGQNIFSGFLRIFGFDTKKIGAIAVNAIIFVAQLISTSLPRGPPRVSKKPQAKEGTPLDWMMNSEQVKDLLDHATDSDLPNRVIEYVKERSLDEDTGCIQQLICKGAPLVWGMQKALRLKTDEQITGKEALFGYFPKLEEVAEHADECERKYPYCFFLE